MPRSESNKDFRLKCKSLWRNIYMKRLYASVFIRSVSRTEFFPSGSLILPCRTTGWEPLVLMVFCLMIPIALWLMEYLLDLRPPSPAIIRYWFDWSCSAYRPLMRRMISLTRRSCLCPTRLTRIPHSKTTRNKRRNAKRCSGPAGVAGRSMNCLSSFANVADRLTPDLAAFG